jgi:hypothetical protein
MTFLRPQITRLKAKYIFLITVLITVIYLASYQESSTNTVTTSSSGQGSRIINNTTVVNGAQFFPIGLYHVSWKTSFAEQINALRDVAAGGFNTIHVSATDLDEHGRFLDEAQRLGVMVISEDGVGLSNLIRTYKDKPAVLGWNIADDVDDGSFTPNEVCELHQLAKSLDPNHITYISGYSDRIGSFSDCADVTAMQSYPIKPGIKYITDPYVDARIAADATAYDSAKTIYSNLQAFDWSTVNSNTDSQVPSQMEIRNMTYQALLGGSKGIIYYTYFHSGWLLTDHPDLWNALQELATELSQLATVYLDGTLQNIYQSSDSILAGIWQNQDHDVLIVLNNSLYSSENLDILIPQKYTSFQPIFADYDSGLSLQNHHMTGVVQPLEVHIYRLN